MELYNIRFEGTLQTQSPLCVVPPGAEEISRPDGSKYKRIAHRTIYNGDARETKPVLPGSTFRGRMRRSAVEVVQGLSGSKITLAEWHQNAVGGVKGAEIEDGHDVIGRSLVRQKNPILALFGAGSPWMISRATIGDAIPIEHVVTDVVGGVRADDGRRDSSFFQKLDDDAPEQWLAMVSANSMRTQAKGKDRSLKADLRAAKKAKNKADVDRIEAQIVTLGKKIKEMDLLSSNPVSMPLKHEAMPAGVAMAHKMILKGVTAAEAGLFVAAMNGFLKQKPHLGQHEAIGYGLVSGEYDVFISINNADPFAIDDMATNAVGTMMAEPHVGLRNVPNQLKKFMASFKKDFEAGLFDFEIASKVIERWEA